MLEPFNQWSYKSPIWTKISSRGRWNEQLPTFFANMFPFCMSQYVIITGFHKSRLFFGFFHKLRWQVFSFFWPPNPLPWHFLPSKGWYFWSTYPPLHINVVCERPLTILGSSTYVRNWYLLSILGWRLCGSGSCQRPQTKPRHQQFFWGHSGQCTKTLSRGDWASSSTPGLWLYFSWKSNPEVPFIYYISTFFFWGGGGQNVNFDLFSGKEAQVGFICLDKDTCSIWLVSW